MCSAVGLEVKRLHRIDFAGITLDGCEGPGTWTLLTEDEINILKCI
jgi:16S rRNA U516 pseudouridylate synthase RsuA-like enzyme